jgi:hypothetical protein
MLRAIGELGGTASAARSSRHFIPPVERAERRQLTVMFCRTTNCNQ